MNVKIAQRLAELRRARGYSQESLARELGLSRQAVFKWERAESSPDTENLIALARLYGVSLDELLRVDEEIEDDVAFERAERSSEVRVEEELGAQRARAEQATQAATAAAEASRAAAEAAQAATRASERVAQAAEGTGRGHAKGGVAVVPVRHPHDSPLVRAHHHGSRALLVLGVLYHPALSLDREHHGRRRAA